MASLRFSLGMIPSTSKIEQQEKALSEEYQKMLKFAESAELSHYNELNSIVNSAGFKQNQRDIEGVKYNGSPEFNKEKEFKSLEKSKEIKMYLKSRDSIELKKFLELDGSGKIQSFEELEKFIGSAAFKEKQRKKPAATKDSPKPVPFKDTEEFAQLQDYKSKKKSSEIKGYYSYKKSKELANFRKVDGSAMFSKYEELKVYVATEEFRARKEYLLDKKRFEKTEAFAQLKEFETLKKNADIVWYFKVKDSNKFDDLKKRELIFSDEFDGTAVDGKKWLTTYYWGEKLLKDRYSMESDLHFHTEKGNIEVRNSVLTLITKPQKVEGKVWSPTKGFGKKEFSYTSGMVNTGNSFRQKFGTFSAKIKLDNVSTKNAFWLLGDRITPHIDICRASKGKVVFDIFRSEKSVAKDSISAKYANDFFIYTLEWTPDKLVWKVNGEVAFVQTGNIPQEPMYISLAGGVDKPVGTVSNMEVDWIRVYKPA